MKAMLLAGVLGVLFLLGFTLAARRFKIQRPAAFLVKLWLACVPLLLALYLLTPADLWLLPAALLDDPPWFGPVFCLGLWFAGFFGGILQLYQLTERGMSLRMLIDIAQRGPLGLSTREMLQAYSDGQGIVWMYQKRLDGLVEGRLVRIENGILANEARGRRVATLYRRLRRLLRVAGWT
jgi:hypothetical protein